MKIFSLETGNFKIDGGAMFGVIPKEMWQNWYPADEKNRCNLSIRSMLVVIENHNILIDTGLGNKQEAKFFNRYYLNGDDTLEKSLQKIGYSFNDITDVIHTHLHFDHCGGSIIHNEQQQLVPAFPNAIFWVSKAHWESATKPNAREKSSFLKENILPMQTSGKLKLIENECELFPNFHIKLFWGHTNGLIVPHLFFKDKLFVFGGDLFPTAYHVPMNYIMSYDMNPMETLKDKERFFEYALKTNTAIFLQHDIKQECCSIQKVDDKIKVEKTFSVNEWFE